MRLLGISVAAAIGAALFVLPVTEASAQGPKICAAKPSKPKNCADWVCGTTGFCQVKDGLGVMGGCIAWKCNAVARKK